MVVNQMWAVYLTQSLVGDLFFASQSVCSESLYLYLQLLAQLQKRRGYSYV